MRHAMFSLFFLMLSCSLAAGMVMPPGNDTDRLALLGFKDRVAPDPYGILSSWNDSIHYCEWEGVSCSHKHPWRVTVLDLSSRGLAGPIAPSIGNLTFLRVLLFIDNNFYGEIPPEIGRLHRLRHLNLSVNSFHGRIPTNLTHCTELRTLGLMSNQLTGGIPAELGLLSKLDQLFLSNNSLTGLMPSSLGNLSSVTILSLGSNHLEGSILEELGKLALLEHFQVFGNMLSGTIPSSLFNLSSLNFISVASNKLHGSLPPDMGNTLPNLQNIYFGGNQFTGPLPPSLSNASRLEEINIPECKLSGQVPPDLGRLKGLSRLNLGINQLEARDAIGWRFFDSLTNCSRLEMLDLDTNKLEGMLPDSVANLSTQLQTLQLGFNPISGNIPPGIQKLINLIIFDIEYSLLSGTIPEGIGKLQTLQELGHQGNKLGGRIPSSLGNLTLLVDLVLSQNNLEGPIPPSLGNLQQLRRMDLSNNNLDGSIPKEILSLPYISIYMDLSNNSLSGTLPLEVGNLKNLEGFGASGNKLSGEIPVTLGNCEVLEYLDLKRNLFQGTIPSSLGNVRGLSGLDLSYNNLSGNIPLSFSDIKGLQELDLSHNNLSGRIPEFLAGLNLLLHLNLSYNHLDGEVPTKGVFSNATALSLIENEGLCGGIPELGLPDCPVISSKTRGRRSLLLKIVIPIAGAVLCLLLLTLFAFLYPKQDSRRKTSTMPPSTDGFPKLSYGELVKATDGFSSVNLLGKGRYGSVYKGSLDAGNIVVAVKVFDLQQQAASRSFVAECDVLRGVRHRNLVKILTACSSVDSKGDDFKALVFEFMPNGSLESWLYPEEDGRSTRLTLIQRLSIATDVANALEYLHHNCQPPIVHCDVKPSNVLLGNDMTAHVGDFGLAKFLSEALSNSVQGSNSSFGIRGTIGYIAPEYGAGGSVSTVGDVYSYGILILELFTGKRPVDGIFKDDLSLQKYVQIGVSTDQVMDIVDSKNFFEDVGIIDYNDGGSTRMNGIRDCLVSVFTVGLSCLNPSPNERMNIRDIAAKMQAIRKAYHQVCAA